MATQKNLSDYSDFADAKQTHNKVAAELSRVRGRCRQIEQMLLAIKDPGKQPSPLAAFLNEQSGATIDREALQREFAELEKRELFLGKAVHEAERQVERARAQASLEICKVARPGFVAQVKRQLEALETLRAANVEIARLRGELEAQGVETGSIPVCVIPEVGNGDETQLGLAVRYRRWIRDNFSEVKA